MIWIATSLRKLQIASLNYYQTLTYLFLLEAYQGEFYTSLLKIIGSEKLSRNNALIFQADFTKVNSRGKSHII